MNIRLATIWVSLTVISSGCTYFAKKKLRGRFESECSYEALNIFYQEWKLRSLGTNVPIPYKFGAHDSEFRKQCEVYIKQFVDSGKDISQGEKVSFVKHFVPKYLATCEAFYEPLIESCVGSDPESQEFRACVEPYDATYKNLFVAFTTDAMMRGSVVDIESFDIQSSEKLYRQQQVDPLSAIAH
jgi:hypothetical protein